MARKRMIDPNIWQSEDFNKLSTLAKLVFIGLFSLADDEGRGRCNPVYLKSSIFPYEESIRSADIDKTLSEISSNMSVIFYSYNGNNFYSLYNWNTWQTINRPTPSRIPPFDEDNKDFHRLFIEDSLNTHGIFTEDSLNAHGGLTPNKNRIEKNKNIIAAADARARANEVDTPEVTSEESKGEEDNPISGLEDVIELYNDNIGAITPLEAEILISYANDTPKDLIMLAIKKAVKAGARSMNYVEGILRSWKRNNITTVLEVEKEEQKFEENKRKQKEEKSVKKKGNEFEQRNYNNLDLDKLYANPQ